MIRQSNEKGFILATSLVMMLLMTMLTAAVFISVDASQKSSMSAESSAEAYYYAETATNYMQWSLYNNVEFDSYTYPQIVREDIVDTDPCVVAGIAAPCAYKFGEPSPRGYDPANPHPVTGLLSNDPYVYLPTPEASGDYDEWRANRFNPSGNDTFSFTVAGAPVNIEGQLMYYDNSPLANRKVWYRSEDMYSNATADAYSTADAGQPELYGVYRYLPRYIMLSIDDYGQITPSMPPVNTALPWHGTDTGDLEADIKADKGVYYPKNGAIVWLTGGNRTDDYEIAPMDVYAAPAYNNRVNPGVWDSDLASPAYGGLPCTLTTTPAAPGDMQNDSAACLTSGTWVDDVDYGLVIYAIGYVRGKPQRLVRVVY